jgi:hypothetical protein
VHAIDDGRRLYGAGEAGGGTGNALRWLPDGNALGRIGKGKLLFYGWPGLDVLAQEDFTYPCAGLSACLATGRHRLVGGGHADTSETSQGNRMITCYLRYIIDPYKLKEFEAYGLWIPLVERWRPANTAAFCRPRAPATWRWPYSRFPV